MFSLEVLIMVGAIVFCVGGLLGALISRSMFPPEQQKMLEQSLNNSRKELDQYQHDVAHHFAETAKLVNDLTQSYKNVHEHLATGALHLTNAEITQRIIDAGDKNLGLNAPDRLDDSHIQAPRDWAPKTSGHASTLSEEFGLDDTHNDDDHDEPHKTPPRRAV